MPARIGPDLNANQHKFASLLAIGLTQTDAYRRVYKTEGLEDNDVSSRASKLANNEYVAARAKAICEEFKLSDLDTANRAIVELLQDIKTCRDLGKWSALKDLTRMRLQIHGLLKENIQITDEQRLTDDQLIQRISKGDKSTERLLTGILKGESLKSVA